VKRVVTTTEEEFARTFLSAAESALELGDRASAAAKQGRCSKANQYAIEMSEEIGALRGIMGSLSEEAAAEQDRMRRATLRKLLSGTQDDYETVVSSRNDLLRQLGKSCRFAKGKYKTRSIPASEFSPNLPFYPDEEEG
jgi:hypothetical protein